jgi:hypothetical protein
MMKYPIAVAASMFVTILSATNGAAQNTDGLDIGEKK